MNLAYRKDNKNNVKLNIMKKTIFTITMLSALLFSACSETPKKPNSESPSAEITTTDTEKVTATDKDGQKLTLIFDNIKGTVLVELNGESAMLTQKESASGIWYSNDQYELRGKANDLELKKDGKVVFVHEDEIVTTSIKNKAGETLDMTFNNTTNEVKVYLNGGEQIDLVGQKAASGIWYSNDHYELRGKGDQLELKKDEKVIFKN